jgi:hypothetical protein
MNIPDNYTNKYDILDITIFWEEVVKDVIKDGVDKKIINELESLSREAKYEIFNRLISGKNLWKK